MRETIELLFYIIIGSGFGAFFAQRLFEHRLNKKLFRFTKLYSDKLDILKDLFRLLVSAEKGLGVLLSQREPNDKKEKVEYYEKTVRPINNFIELYEENEIIFEEPIVEQINEIINILENAKTTHFKANNLEESRPSKAWENAVSTKQELSEKLENEFPKLKMKLKKEFQVRYEILSK